MEQRTFPGQKAASVLFLVSRRRQTYFPLGQLEQTLPFPAKALIGEAPAGEYDPYDPLVVFAWTQTERQHAFYVACVGQNPVSVSSVREPFLRSLCLTQISDKRAFGICGAVSCGLRGRRSTHNKSNNSIIIIMTSIIISTIVIIIIIIIIVVILSIIIITVIIIVNFIVVLTG
ncbi:hypothetical protein AK812_SmicGene20715 [Symbiodinium microadriaticum]|uniref:Uncharacterized protein n=1 Tax=Symbiodinium microadriaticum TaxID=2951 RepID=A0A1Q9DP86_SYMMI|nr:hypothetical protein AK812_SmicGene20715 [Symbiodinium microadriaticum]